MIATIDDEKTLLKQLYEETTDHVLQIYLIAIGKSINELLEKEEIIFFDTLSDKEVMDKVLNNIDYERINKWLCKKGFI